MYDYNKFEIKEDGIDNIESHEGTMTITVNFLNKNRRSYAVSEEQLAEFVKAQDKVDFYLKVLKPLENR